MSRSLPRKVVKKDIPGREGSENRSPGAAKNQTAL